MVSTAEMELLRRIAERSCVARLVPVGVRRGRMRLSEAGAVLLPRAAIPSVCTMTFFSTIPPDEDIHERQRTNTISLLKGALDELEGRPGARGVRP